MKHLTTLSLWLMLWACATVLTSCSNDVWDENDEAAVTAGEDNDSDTKLFTFNVKENDTFKTRATATAESNMTDLWLFDYVNGTLVQSLHQEKGDTDFGTPQLRLTFEQHHIYFVASRGLTPAVDSVNHKIVWGSPKDTFWKDYEITVTSSSSKNRSLTLARVATKFTIKVNDKVPGNIQMLGLTPTKWYAGLDYTTGGATNEISREFKVSDCSSYRGTTGKMSMSIFGIAPTSEFTTDITVSARDVDGNTIASSLIEDVPMKRNRSTDYSGDLFGASGTVSLLLDDTWEQDVTGTF